MANDEKKKEDILQLIRTVIEEDKALREQFQIGEKFRFIRDRLNALLSHAEVSLTPVEKKEEHQTIEKMSADESLVFIHLYNAQGLALQTWQKMVNSAVFYEHSVNRPIYREKSHVDAFIRGKSNKAQHAYLTVVVQTNNISQAPGTELSKDALGNPLIKVREGSLQFKKLISFTHNGNEYTVDEHGGLVKK